jgi:chemotaxis signal transduction protein
MSCTGAKSETLSLNLLLFTAGGVSFGVDVEQIDGMADYSGEPADDLHWFHEILPFGNKTVTYHLPTVLSIKTLSQQPYRVIIDQMQDIAEYHEHTITPLPPLMEPYALKYGIWGIVHRAGQLVLLVDFQRMTQNS